MVFANATIGSSGPSRTGWPVAPRRSRERRAHSTTIPAPRRTATASGSGLGDCRISTRLPDPRAPGHEQEEEAGDRQPHDGSAQPAGHGTRSRTVASSVWDAIRQPGGRSGRGTQPVTAWTTAGVMASIARRSPGATVTGTLPRAHSSAPGPMSMVPRSRPPARVSPGSATTRRRVAASPPPSRATRTPRSTGPSEPAGSTSRSPPSRATASHPFPSTTDGRRPLPDPPVRRPPRRGSGAPSGHRREERRSAPRRTGPPRRTRAVMSPDQASTSAARRSSWEAIVNRAGSKASFA